MARTRKRKGRRRLLGDRRPPSPSIPTVSIQPSPAQVREARRWRAERARTITPRPVAEFADWLRQQDHSFGEAWASLLPAGELDSGGVMVSPDPEALERVQSLADDAHAAFLAKQREAFARLREAVGPLDPGPLLCGAMFFLRFAPWGSY